MAKAKQHVFSARTTEEGLRRLNELRKERGVGWDDLVIDAMCERYGLDRAMMTLPRKEKPAKEAESTQPAGQTGGERPVEAGEEKPPEEKPARKRGKGGKANK